MTDERLAEIDARLKARVEDESDWSGIADLLAEVRRLRGLATELMRMSSEVLAFCEPGCQHPVCVRDREIVAEAREALAYGAPKGEKLGESCGNGGEN